MLFFLLAKVVGMEICWKKIALLIFLASLILAIACVIFGKKTYVEEYAIPLHNVQDFKVKTTEDYCTWDDGYGETYIVSKDLVKVETFPDDELRIYSVICSYEYGDWQDWVKVYFHFGLIETSPYLVSKTYQIRCPERSLVISQKSNREVKWPFF